MNAIDNKVIKAAIKQRARKLSERHAKHVKAQLREAVAKYGANQTEAQLLDLVQCIDLPESFFVTVPRDVLWQLTQRLSTLDTLRQQVNGAIEQLENETGMKWCK